MKMIFKFLGKGFGENPLFKEGSPRRTLPEKIINALLSFSGRRGAGRKPLFAERGVSAPRTFLRGIEKIFKKVLTYGGVWFIIVVIL